MKLVRFSYENGELADHEICAIDFPPEMENLREGTIALVWQERTSTEDGQPG